MILPLLAAAALAAPLDAKAVESFDIDPAHSSVSFKVKHLGISTVPGSFRKFTGAITVDGRRSETAKVAAVIETASIDTGIADRDKHLAGPDFFDAAKFPELRFESARVSPVKDGRFTLDGLLTLHGVTRPVRLTAVFGGTAKDPWGGERAAFSASGKIDRKDFGLTWNKALDNGGLLIGNEVSIALEIEATLRKDEAAKAPVEVSAAAAADRKNRR